MSLFYGKLLIFLFLCVGLIEGSCTFRSAKWSKVSLKREKNYVVMLFSGYSESWPHLKYNH